MTRRFASFSSGSIAVYRAHPEPVAVARIVRGAREIPARVRTFDRVEPAARSDRGQVRRHSKRCGTQYVHAERSGEEAVLPIFAGDVLAENLPAGKTRLAQAWI